MYKRLPPLLVVLIGLADEFACSPAFMGSQTPPKPSLSASNLANLTGLFGSIPPEFRVVPDLELPIRFPAEACFTNIIAALQDVALGDFTGKMHVHSYRTLHFPYPLIKMNSPDLVDVKRQFMVWGLFLVAFYLHTYNSCNMGFFSLQWKGEEVAGIGIAGTWPSDGNIALQSPSSNKDVIVNFAFYGAPVELGKGSVFITIIESMLEAAPQAADARIYTTIINYLRNEPAAFIVTPTQAARGDRGPYFTNEVLIDILARSAEYYATSRIYRQLELNISVEGVKVAQGAFALRKDLGSLSFFNATEEQDQALLIA
ncbi:MAG: hypothetical protein Q9226_004369 [Calogaya cf. arnoldii]